MPWRLKGGLWLSQGNAANQQVNALVVPRLSDLIEGKMRQIKELAGNRLMCFQRLRLLKGSLNAPPYELARLPQTSSSPDQLPIQQHSRHRSRENSVQFHAPVRMLR